MRAAETAVLRRLLTRHGYASTVDDVELVTGDESTWDQLRLGILRGDSVADVAGRLTLDEDLWMDLRADAPRLFVVEAPLA